MLKDYLINNTIPQWAIDGFYHREQQLAEIVREPKLETVIWEATRRCDLRCVHCGTPNDNKKSIELSTTEVKDVFSSINDSFKIETLTAVSITGGEPTIRNDLSRIVRHIYELGAKQIVMHTNGQQIARNHSLLTDLISAGITGVGVNVDGLESNHNYIRQNKESFRNSILSLKIAQNQGVDTMVSTILTNHTYIDLEPLREIILDLQPKRWRLIPLEPIGRARKVDLLSQDLLAAVVNFVLETNLLYPDLTIELGCGQWFGKKLEGLVRPYIWHCIAGLNVMGILHDGMIGACNNIDRFYCQGSFLKDEIMDVWKNRFKAFRERDWCRTEECNTCIDWNLCRGGEMHLRSREGKRLAPCFYHSYVSKISSHG